MLDLLCCTHWSIDIALPLKLQYTLSAISVQHTVWQRHLLVKKHHFWNSWQHRSLEILLRWQIRMSSNHSSLWLVIVTTVTWFFVWLSSRGVMKNTRPSDQSGVHPQEQNLGVSTFCTYRPHKSIHLPNQTMEKHKKGIKIFCIGQDLTMVLCHKSILPTNMNNQLLSTTSMLMTELIFINMNCHNAHYNLNWGFSS